MLIGIQGVIHLGIEGLTISNKVIKIVDELLLIVEDKKGSETNKTGGNRYSKVL